jgi:hypothetical protein
MAIKEAEAIKIEKVISEKIEFLREEAKQRGERFESLATDQLILKIMGKTSKSPYFYAQSWGNASPGGTMTYRAYVHNPDPTGYSGYWLFGHMFFGPANYIADADIAMTSIDGRFPHYLQRCTVAAGSDTSMTFSVLVPAGIISGIYMGNCFLVKRNSFDVGGYIDRAAFDLEVP